MLRLFSVKEVEQITRVRSHILQCWAETVPFLQPQKDAYARWQYTVRDVQFVLRLQYLQDNENLMLDEAIEQILTEIADERKLKTILNFNLLKTELLELFQATKKLSINHSELF
ncbi:MAG: MerR family transcriptional regulator [Treponemataceae bacterium]